MDMDQLTRFFLWCTIINFGLMCLMFLMFAFAGDFAYGIHSAWFPMPRATFDLMLYGFLSLYKFVVFIFNLVPYMALRIVARA